MGPEMAERFGSRWKGNYRSYCKKNQL